MKTDIRKEHMKQIIGTDEQLVCELIVNDICEHRESFLPVIDTHITALYETTDINIGLWIDLLDKRLQKYILIKTFKY